MKENNKISNPEVNFCINAHLSATLSETNDPKTAEMWAVLYLRMMRYLSPEQEEDAKLIYGYVLESIRFFYRIKQEK